MKDLDFFCFLLHSSTSGATNTPGAPPPQFLTNPWKKGMSHSEILVQACVEECY